MKKKAALKNLSQNELHKKYPGSGVASDITVLPEDLLWIPSRCLPLNYSMGGGIPYGKIVEFYGSESSGKTVIAQDFGYVTQALGGVILWDDAEQAYSDDWAKLNGLDPSRIELYPETSVEKVSDWLRDMVLYHRSKLVNNEPILFICDSLAALDCEDNINSSQYESKAEMGNRAKAIYKMIRIRNQFLTKAGVSSIYINQVRQKVGANGFQDPDCFHHDTLIPFVNGEVHTIGEIVEHHMAGEVWSYNEGLSIFEPKPIKAWIKKEKLGENEKWINIITNGPGSKGGKFGITCTERHGILTTEGWVNAKNLTLQHKVISKYTSIVNGTLKDFLYGSFIGDSSLRVRSINTARYQLQDSENESYLRWKISKLENFFSFSPQVDSHGNIRFRTDYSVELGILAKIFTKRDPLIVLSDSPSTMSLAIWYMDDGHLSNGNQASISISPKRTDLHEVRDLLCSMGYTCNTYDKGIRFTRGGFEKFSRGIRSMVPESMQYKLLHKDRGHYEDFTLSCIPVVRELPVGIISISEAGKRSYRRLHKYDIEVEDNHNFIAGGKDNGFIAHNTTPGGNAMKFFASIRLGLYAGKQIKHKIRGVESRVGNETSIRIKKNKVAIPRATYTTEIYFNPDYRKPLGPDRYKGLSSMLVQEGTLTKKGNIYLYGGEKVALGESACDLILEKDDSLRKAILNDSKINTLSKTRKMMKGINGNRYKITVKDAETEE